MDLKALHKISYGLYIITSRKENRHNGQVANTVFQISTDPLTIAVSLNKNNLTNQFIKESKLFTVSVLAQDVPLSLIGRFGFKSGREVDKFEGINCKRGSTGVRYLVDGILTYLEAEVIREVDAGTHDIFIGKVNGAEVLKEGEPLTYAYYHQVKKGGTPKTAPLPLFVEKENGGQRIMNKYVCLVCGYVYDPDTGDAEHSIPPGTPFEKLPEDWVCPVCYVGKDQFEKEENNIMKKWRCKVCGYVHEGESPPEKCPNCGASKEKFELLTATSPDLVDWNKIGVAKGSGFEEDLKMQFRGECMEVGMYIAMARQAEREGYAEIAETMKRIAWEEAHHAARFCELLGEISESTEKNLENLVDGEAGANRGKKEIADRSKKEGQDAIHDAIHEACKDEARHCMAFYGLLKRYFPKGV